MQIANAHAISVHQLAADLSTDLQSGLSSTKAAKRLEQSGLNELHRQKPKSLLKILLDQVLDPIILLLLAAAAAAFVFDELLQGFAILVVILLTALIGFLMEWQALKSMNALRKLSQSHAAVIRQGKRSVIPVTQLVPGDLALIELGDVVPADGRIITCANLGVKEAALTGESGQVDKQLCDLPSSTALVDQINMAFSGTIVSRGSATLLVTATGDDTELGKIAMMTGRAKSAATPLEKKLNRLGRRLIILTLFLALLIIFFGLFRGRDLWLMVETGIALAVAAIPEGLPIVATIALARGMLRLAKDRVIIKRLEAVEALGEIGIIFTDKTGTLTENSMAVAAVAVDGFYEEDWPDRNSKDWQTNLAFQEMLLAGVLCNESAGQEDNVHGDPLEKALLDLAIDANCSIDKTLHDYREVSKIPFDTETRMMTTIHEHDNQYFVSVKGAVEHLIPHCNHQLSRLGKQDALAPRIWLDLADDMASKGLRTLAIASRKMEKQKDLKGLVKDLSLLGIIGFLDPPRSDVKGAIDTYRRAGIRVVMVTGDHPLTAQKIALETGILEPHQKSSVVMSGPDIPEGGMNADKFREQVLSTSVFARVLPIQKLQLVELFQAHDYVVGMTGDGVNDAPALKKADIGIAMGTRGTEAAKEVADVILRDDQFTSIELALWQGRTIFENIRKFVIYLMSSNLAEIISVALAFLTNLPLPLLPLQILFLNLVTDIFPALAIGLSSGDQDLMDQPPRSTKEMILTRKHWIDILTYGFSIAACVVGATVYATHLLGLSANVVNNIGFLTLVIAQLLNVFNLAAPKYSPLQNEITKNAWIWMAILLSLLIVIVAYYIPITRQVLSFTTLNMSHLLVIAMFSFASLFLAQFLKHTLHLLRR